MHRTQQATIQQIMHQTQQAITLQRIHQRTLLIQQAVIQKRIQQRTARTKQITAQTADSFLRAAIWPPSVHYFFSIDSCLLKKVI